MSELDDPPSANLGHPERKDQSLKSKHKLQTAPLIAIEVSGKNKDIWKKRRPRFFQRLINSIKSLFKGDIPPSATANSEILDAADEILHSAQEAIKSPQLINQERQANIKNKYADTKLKEAEARKAALEADILEMEYEREMVHHSQKLIERMIQRGELILLKEDNGEIVLLYKGQGR